MSSSDSAVWIDLTGPSQGWLRRCRAAAAGNPTAVAELSDDDGPAARALQRGGTRVARHASGLDQPIESHDWAVGVATRALALALAKRSSLGPAVDGCLRYVHRAGLVSALDPEDPVLAPAAWPAARRDPVLADTLGALAGVDLPEAVPFVALLAADLRRCSPPAVRSVTTPVLFSDPRGGQAGPTVQHGVVAALTLELHGGGPPGLHPSPRTSLFLTTDAEFRAAMQRAWETALSLHGQCVTWSLRSGADAQPPIEHVRGNSLGGAVAVALMALASRLGRAHRLDPRCAVSAALPPRTQSALQPVSGLEAKTAAARQTGLRLVVAEPDVVRARTTTCGSQVRVDGARDLAEALRRARQAPGRQSLLRLTAAVTVGVLLVVGLGVTRASQRQVVEQREAADRTIQAQQLALRSRELLPQDPGLATYVALASYHTVPTPAGVDALTAALAANPASARRSDLPYPKGDGALWHGLSHPALGTSYGWFADGRSLTTTSLTTLRPVARASSPCGDGAGTADVRCDLVLAPAQDRLAALDVARDTVAVYQVEWDGSLVPGVTLPAPSRLRETWLSWSPDGRQLLAVSEGAHASVWTSGQSRFTNLDLGWRASTGARDPEIYALVDASRGPDWRVLLTASVAGSADQGSDRAAVLTLQPRAHRVRRLIGPARGGSWYQDLTPVPGGAFFTSDGTRTVRSFAADGGRRTWRLPAIDKVIAATSAGDVAYTDGDAVATGKDGRSRHLFTVSHDHAVVAARYLPDHRLAVVDSAGQLVVTPGVPPGRAPTMKVARAALEVTADGRTSVTADADDEHTWGVEVHRPVSPRQPLGTGASRTFGVPLSPRSLGVSTPHVVVSDRYAGRLGGVGLDVQARPASGPSVATVMLWDLESGKPVVEDRCGPALSDKVGGLSPDGSSLVVLSDDRICRWLLPGGARRVDVRLPAGSSDRSTGTGTDTELDPKQVRVLDHQVIVTGTKAFTVMDGGVTVAEPPRPFTDATISPDGRMLATLEPDGLVRVTTTQDLGSTRWSTRLQEHVLGLTWSPDGKNIAVLDDVTSVTVLEGATGIQVRPTIGLEHRLLGDVQGVAWPTAGSLVVAETAQEEPEQRSYETIDLTGAPSWGSAVCPLAPTPSRERWSTAVSEVIPYQTPCG